MALSSVTIGGTAHLLTGGKVVIDGTAYSLEAPDSKRQSGYAVIDGTYHIIYLPPWDIIQLGKAVSKKVFAGRNASTAAAVTLTLPSADTYFVFSICNGHCGIYKVVYDGTTSTKTTVIQSNAGANIYCSGATIKASNSDTSTGTNRYGATLAAFTFNAPPDLVTATFQKYTLTKLAGRNSSTASTVSCTRDSLYPSAGSWWILATGEYVLIQTVVSVSDKAFTDGICWNAPSAIKNTMYRKVTSSGVTYAYLTLDATTNASVYGGSMIIATANS